MWGGYVIRRVGGLEVSKQAWGQLAGVIRRVGGLEVLKRQGEAPCHVIRRVGGLEGEGPQELSEPVVIPE